MMEREVFALNLEGGKKVLFDVEKARRLWERPELRRWVDVATSFGSADKFAAYWCWELDTERAMTVPLEGFAITLFWEGEPVLVDGHHRIYKVLALGQDRVPMLFVEDPELVKPLVITELDGEGGAILDRVDREGGGALLIDQQTLLVDRRTTAAEREALSRKAAATVQGWIAGSSD